MWSRPTPQPDRPLTPVARGCGAPAPPPARTPAHLPRSAQAPAVHDAQPRKRDMARRSGSRITFGHMADEPRPAESCYSCATILFLIVRRPPRERILIGD